MTVTSTDIYRIVDGKIVEQWLEADFTGFTQKLLASPYAKARDVRRQPRHPG